MSIQEDGFEVNSGQPLRVDSTSESAPDRCYLNNTFLTTMADVVVLLIEPQPGYAQFILCENYDDVSLAGSRWSQQELVHWVIENRRKWIPREVANRISGFPVRDIEEERW